MKTVITALAFVLFATGPTFAASLLARHLREGRACAYVPQSSGYYA